MHCQNKNRYFSESEANETAAHQEELHGIKLRSYHCQDCGWWHLTKNLDWLSFIKPNQNLSQKRKKRRKRRKFSFEEYLNLRKK